MSLNNLTFANRIIYKNIYNEPVAGDIAYNDNGVYTESVRDVTQFSLDINPNYQTKTIFKCADGKKIRIHYKTDYDDTQKLYTLSYYFDFVDQYDALITFPSSIAYNNPTQTYTADEYWDTTQPGFDTFPFSVCYYSPSWVGYYQQGQPTIVNDPAISVYPLGVFYWKHSRPPIGGYVDIIGDQAIDVLRGSYGDRFVSVCVLSTDQGYDDFYGTVDPNNIWHDTGDIEPDPDPSGPGGGDRPTDDDGDPVDFPDLPTTSVINTGLISLYNPTDVQLRSLAGVLWSNDFENSIKKILNDPFDGLIGLSMVPFTPTTSGSINCDIGNFDTNVSMPVISAQYYTLDCGTLTLKENWKNALDYNSTIVDIFVPFVGFRPLDIQDCMGQTLALKYNVDILTGAAVAILKCGNKCLYEWPCNLAYNIPLTGSNKAALYTGLINVAMSSIGGLAAGGAMGAVGGGAASAINVATHAQSNVQRSGSLSSNTGTLGEFTPYIVVHRPKQSLAQNFKAFKGYQSNITSILGNCDGYTEVEFIHLTGIDGATDTELNEIERLLKEGVLI